MPLHMVIPDAHSNPEYNNDRFELLGHVALERRPDVIIDMGDWADMASLCSYDKGTRAYEGRRYRRDIESAVDARKRFNLPIDMYNRRRANNRKAQYKPRKVALTGNHEERILRATQLSPELDGTISLRDLQREEHGWETYDFLVPVEIDGIFYSHYFTSGILGRPIGGEHPATSLLVKQHVSCTAGHSHLRDFSERTLPNGKRIIGLVAGCFIDYDMLWAPEQVRNMWWSGVVFCHNVKEGVYDPEFIPLDVLKEMYQ